MIRAGTYVMIRQSTRDYSSHAVHRHSRAAQIVVTNARAVRVRGWVAAAHTQNIHTQRIPT